MRGAVVLACLLAGATSLLAGATRAAAQAEPPVFRAQVESVYVDAFVTRDGRAVSGLLASDFELKDNGVPQRPELVSAEGLPLLAVLAFDQSVSVAGEKIQALRAAGRAFLAGLKPEDEVALVPFSQQIQWTAGPTRDREAVLAALERLGARGNTAALDALYAAITLPATPARKLVVLFTDGQDNLSWLDEGEVRQAAERSNALVHVVTVRSSWVGAWSEPEYVRALRAIAETTGGKAWEAASPARLQGAFAAIADAMRQRYVLRYEPDTEKRQGWHRIELRLRRGKAHVQARRGYWVEGPAVSPGASRSRRPGS